MTKLDNDAKKLIKHVQNDMDTADKLRRKCDAHKNNLYGIERKKDLNADKYPAAISPADRKVLKKHISTLFLAKSDYGSAILGDIQALAVRNLEMEKMRDQVKFNWKDTLTPFSDEAVKSLTKTYIALARKQTDNLIVKTKTTGKVRKSLVAAVDQVIGFLKAKKVDKEKETKAYVTMLQSYKKMAAGFDSSKSS